MVKRSISTSAAHTVVLDQPKKKTFVKGKNTAPSELLKVADYAVVFSCESRTDITQDLTFGSIASLKLNGDTYLLEERAHSSTTTCHWRSAKSWKHAFVPSFDKKSFPPNFPLIPRSDFIRSVFYKYARQGALLVGFDLCYALRQAGAAMDTRGAEEWSLVLSVYPDGNENAHDPRVLITPLDSKKGVHPLPAGVGTKDGKAIRTDVHKSRFLDLRTLVAAEFGKPVSVKAACELVAFEKFALPRKSDYLPTVV